MSNDWYSDPPDQTPDRQPTSQPPPEPRKNPDDGSLGVDDLEIKSSPRPSSVTSGAIGQAWERVKERPVETLLFSFLSLLFGNNTPSCNVPSPGGFDSSGTDTGTGGSGGSGTDFDTVWGGLSEVGARIGDTLGSMDWGVGARPAVLGMPAAEVGIIVAVIAAVLFALVIVLVLGGLVESFSNVYWLRLIRGQSADLGDTGRAVHFLVPVVFTSILQQLAIVGGLLLLIIPGIMAALGFQFATFVVVDKNIGYIDALKASWRMTDGYKGQLFAFLFLIALLNLGGVLACCVGMIVTNAIGMGALAIVYDRLSAPGNAYLERDEDIVQVFE